MLLILGASGRYYRKSTSQVVGFNACASRIQGAIWCKEICFTSISVVC